METKKVDKWFNNLVGNRKYAISNDEIKAMWDPIRQELTTEEQINLLIELVQKDSVFKWLYPITYVLPALATDDENFVNLVEIVIDKIKNDLAQGPFVKALIKIGENDPAKGVKLYDQLSKRKSDAVVGYSGLFLGGAAKKSFESYYPLIIKSIREAKEPIKVACFRALRVALEKPTELKVPDEIFVEMSKFLNTDYFALKAEIIKAYVDFDSFNPTECEGKLLEIAKSGDTELRFLIINSLFSISLTNREKEVELLKVVAQDDNTALLDRLLWTIAEKGHSFLGDSLEIIKLILKKPIARNVPDMDYYVSELCKEKPDQCLKILNEWLEGETDQLLIYRTNRLIELIKRRQA